MPGGRPRNRLRIPEEQGRCTKEALAGGARTTSRNDKGCYLCQDVVCTEAPGAGERNGSQPAGQVCTSVPRAQGSAAAFLASSAIFVLCSLLLGSEMGMLAGDAARKGQRTRGPKPEPTKFTERACPRSPARCPHTCWGFTAFPAQSSSRVLQADFLRVALETPASPPGRPGLL